jgi:hypothetical protein
MKDEIYREPLAKSDNPIFVYIWNEHSLVQMQWVYSIEWLKDGGPTIWIMSYCCWQRQTPSAQFEKVDDVPFDVPVSDWLLYRLAEHAGMELFRRSVIVGSLKNVPQNFFGRAEEAAAKGYNLKLLREMSQREAAETTPD